MNVGKSRKGKRKEARLDKKKNKYETWLQHQINQKSFIRNNKEKRSNRSIQLKLTDNFDEDYRLKMKGARRNKEGERNSKTKFEQYLEMEGLPGVAASAAEDLQKERRLAKKLKVKDGRLRGDDDGINSLFSGIQSRVDYVGGREELQDGEEYIVQSSKDEFSTKRHKKSESLEVRSESELSDGEFNSGISFQSESESEDETAMKHSRNRHKKKKHTLKRGPEVEVGRDIGDGYLEAKESHGSESTSEEVHAESPVSKIKYTAPHLRSNESNDSEYSQTRRQVRGLLNRLSESNVESITNAVSALFRSLPRSVASEIVTEEVLASCSNGPRTNEQYAAVFAAFVAGMACSVGIDFGAKLIAFVAKSFEDEYLKKDNLSLRNLTLLLSFLFIFGVCSSDLIYDFLIILSKRLTEVDVSTILTILQCCGMKLRGDDPVALKNFIQCVQKRVNEFKTPNGDGKAEIDNKRMEFMLETICNIKNNKKRTKEDSVQHTRIKKWLQKLRGEDILIRGLTWSKLLDPDKKGQWWLCGDAAPEVDNVEEVANKIDMEILEAQKMLQLAAAQRMNTDARKAIFCIIMSGEDYIDAFEKLIRLDLQGKQDREIMRVLVDCCLQEKLFNKYYTVLASKLCSHDKNHKFTLQYCLWDQFKELESMPLIRSMHLAKFVAEMIASFAISLAVLKAADLNVMKLLTPKRIMHFRMLFEGIFERPDSLVWNVFTRIAAAPELETLRDGVEFFIREYVDCSKEAFAGKFRVAKKAMNNVEGVLM